MRLSALGDTCHVVPVLRTLQDAWPNTRFSWIIGRAEARLMSLIEGVEFITVNKHDGVFGARRELQWKLAGRRFDALLHMQLAMRASWLAQAVNADVKVGFDRARARELQWLFTNAEIPARQNEHVLDSFFGFATALGVAEKSTRWDVPLPEAALEYAAGLIPDNRRTLVISPCSSHVHRNWTAQGYASVARHALLRHGAQVILAGGPSPIERDMGAAIERLTGPEVVNQIGKDTLPQLLALLSRATALLSPDSGPAHMATMVGTPVIGLYAATRSARSGPYLSRQWCVDVFAAAARRFRGRDPQDLPWGAKIEAPGVMDLITVEAVTAKVDELLG